MLPWLLTIKLHDFYVTSGLQFPFSLLHNTTYYDLTLFVLCTVVLLVGTILSVCVCVPD